MKSEKKIWDKFLEFEKDHNLFALQDDRGTYFWDIVRFQVYIAILWGESTKAKRTFFFVLRKVVFMLCDILRLLFLTKSKENFFYMTSRNKDEKGQLFDQNSQAVYDCFSPKNSMVLESHYLQTYKNSKIRNKFLLPQLFYRHLSHYKKQDFSSIRNLIQEEFGKEFDDSFFNKLMKTYYADCAFYSWLLKAKKIKRVFIVQNDVQKALMIAAKELGLPTFEFQHSVVDVGYLLYNYPKIDHTERQVILPDTLLTFSPFWLQDVYLPNVKIVAIGNDYFLKPLQEAVKNKGTAKGLTVISTDVFGQILSEFLVKSEIQKILQDIPVYFKLHPYQFGEKKNYEEKFKDFENLKVVTNEWSVGELLQQSDTIFAVQTTAIYEALQAQKKVIVLKRSSYERQQHIFEHSNLYLVDTEEEFADALAQEIDRECKTEYFAPFEKERFLRLL